MNIFEAKQKYGNLYLLRFEDKKAVIFRILKWGEFKSYRNILVAFPALKEQFKEFLYKNYVVESSFTSDHGDVAEIEAGVVETISNVIWRLSGAESVSAFSDDLDTARLSVIQSAEERLKGMAAMIYKYQIDDFENVEWPDFLKVVANTELILGNQMLEIPFKLVDNTKPQAIDFDKENKEEEDM